jgi:hypothetical protein
VLEKPILANSFPEGCQYLHAHKGDKKGRDVVNATNMRKSPSMHEQLQAIVAKNQLRNRLPVALSQTHVDPNAIV